MIASTNLSLEFPKPQSLSADLVPPASAAAIAALAAGLAAAAAGLAATAAALATALAATVGLLACAALAAAAVGRSTEDLAGC